jgi:hypothetical protein
MRTSLKLVALLLATSILFGCNDSAAPQNPTAKRSAFNLADATYFNEFVPCTLGSESSPEKMNQMIAEWKTLINSEALDGGWIYLPASEENTYPADAWWELQWASKESADEAWEQWAQDSAAIDWTAKYESVLSCDAQNRNNFEAVFPVDADEFGEFSDSGYFYSEVLLCRYEKGADKNDAKEFLNSYTEAVRASDYQGTGYHFGNYYASDNTDADFLWGEYTNSKPSYDRVVELFARDVEPTQFPLFSEFASCKEETDKYNGWTVYERDESDSSTDFTRM